MDRTRMQKLLAAIYRVTDRMEDAEPMRWRLREYALELSELCGEEENILSFHELERRNKRIQSLLVRIISILELASGLSYVSRTNFEVLLGEYRAFEEELFPQPDPILLDEKSTSRTYEEVKIPLPTRQEKILNYLAERKSAGVGELAAYFQNRVSEKTIQRDLNELTVSGRVRIEGEKRWRRYSISR